MGTIESEAPGSKTDRPVTQRKGNQTNKQTNKQTKHTNKQTNKQSLSQRKGNVKAT